MAVNIGDHTPDTPKLGGSIFINNTSYSGADIRVVVSIYDNGQSSKICAEQYAEEIRKSEIEQFQVLSNIEKTKTELETVHSGTQDETNLKRRLSRLKQTESQLNDLVETLGDMAKDIKKDKMTATTKVLAEVQTLSISTHRDKQAVYACGSVYPRGYTRGPRVIAGSLIFTVFDEHVLYQFLEAHPSDFDAVAYTSALMDQLPPVDILAVFANEYGSTSRMTLYGVEFVNEGQTMSIEDILTENVVQFVARDYDPMRAVSKRKIDANNLLMEATTPMRASDLLLEEDYQAVKDILNPFVRARRRRDPFL